MRRADLLRLARERLNPDLTERQLDDEVEDADDFEMVDGVVRLAGNDALATDADGAAMPEESTGARTFQRLERIDAVDLETVLRYTERHPDGERTIFQVGALRFGAPDWAASALAFDRFIRLPDMLAERIGKPDPRASIPDPTSSPETVATIGKWTSNPSFPATSITSSRLARFLATPPTSA